MAHADKLYQRVLEKNTFYFYDPDFEEEYDARHITRLRTQLLFLYEKVRKRDLKRMVSAYDDVFTFHPDELARFRKLLTDTF